MSKEIVRTDGAPAAVGPYSQGVLVDGWLWTCGQVALDPASGEIAGDDAAAQTDRALRNLAAVLEAGGSSIAQVVKTTVYLKSMGDFAAVNEVYARHFRDPYPARSCVEVSALPKGALVEIDAVARVA